jgi:dihydroorotate dehydrogenase
MVKTSNHPIGIKLGYQDPYMEICSQLKGYIQWVDVINTVPWNMIRPDPSPLKPFAGVDGGVSGPCIAQHARKVLQDLVPVGIPILSGGGIFSYPEVETRFNLGASAVTFATLFSYQPWKPNQIVNKWNRNHATHAVTK